MKRIFTFLLALCITASAIAQITLPSNFTALSPKGESLSAVEPQA